MMFIILGGSIDTKKKTIENLIFASKETGLETNADKTKYMVVSRDQKAGQHNNINYDNKDFEKMKLFKYLERK